MSIFDGLPETPGGYGQYNPVENVATSGEDEGYKWGWLLGGAAGGGVYKLFSGGASGSGNPGPSAAGRRAKIAREQWADYKKRYVPLEDMLLGYVRDRKNGENKFTLENRTGALERVDQSFARAPDQINRRLNSYGLQNTPGQQQRIERQVGLQHNLSKVQAANMSDRLSKDQLLGIMGGTMFSGSRELTGTDNKPSVGRT